MNRLELAFRVIGREREDYCKCDPDVGMVCDGCTIRDALLDAEKLQAKLAEVTEQRDEAWKTVHEYSLHAFANMSKEQQTDRMKIFKELAGE